VTPTHNEKHERKGAYVGAEEAKLTHLESTARRRRAGGHAADVAPRLPAASLNLEIRILVSDREIRGRE
jgi:hypothetical protein